MIFMLMMIKMSGQAVVERMNSGIVLGGLSQYWRLSKSQNMEASGLCILMKSRIIFSALS